ncbi:MAG: flagellar hook-associated protein FlgL [candidate division Zixibacteria bacterium]|nr:flagellar hook-associated protein FlgL [candidate division Zixibacteria bacterium]
MRVSSKMMSDRVLFNLTRATTRLLDLQTASSSGRRINRPSDDPLGIIDDLNYRFRLSDIAQFNSNIRHSKSWLSYSDMALSSINDLIINANDIAVQLSNDTYDEAARIAGAETVSDIFSRMLEAVNSQYQGNYIFGGSKMDLPPILAADGGIIYQGDYQDIMIETDKNSYLNINSFGSEFMTKRVTVLGENFDLNPGLQPNLWLTELNAGAGVNMGAGHITINTLNGSYDVDLSGNINNIQQILDEINITTAIPNLIASIAGSGSGLQLEDTTAHHLTLNTPISMLNGGSGISTAAGTDITISTGIPGPLTANIDLSGAADLNDAINIINAQLPAAGIMNVTASIDPDDNKIVITDTSAIPRDLIIDEFSNGTTAADLGIKGTVNAVMQGTDLQPLHIQVLESAAGETLADDLGLLMGTENNILLGDDTNPRLTYHTKLASLNSNAGIQLGVIQINNGVKKVDIDLSPLQDDPNATILDIVEMINNSGIGAKAYLNDDRTGIMVKSQYDDRSFMITEADSGRTASALGIFGSSDLLGTVRILENALTRNNIEEIKVTLDVFTKALDNLLISRSSVGSRVIRAESAETDMLNQELLITNQLSEVEDADMIRVITELANAEIIYQTALASAARVIQPSLMDFLR